MEIVILPTGIYMTNTYIIVNNGEAVVIDPGAQARYITDTVKRHGGTIKHILITHAHFDHVGAVADLKTDGVTVCMSAVDTALREKIQSVGDDIYVKPYAVDRTFGDCDVLELCGIKFEVIATPGHTPGSCCFICNDECMFSGDTLFRLGVGRTDFIGGDRTELIKSLKKLFALSTDYPVYPGHGEPTTLFTERKNNPYARS